MFAYLASIQEGQDPVTAVTQLALESIRWRASQHLGKSRRFNGPVLLGTINRILTCTSVFPPLQRLLVVKCYFRLID